MKQLAYCFQLFKKKKEKGKKSHLERSCLGALWSLHAAAGESLWPVLHSSSFGNDQCTSENANVRIVTLL